MGVLSTEVTIGNFTPPVCCHGGAKRLWMEGRRRTHNLGPARDCFTMLLFDDIKLFISLNRISVFYPPNISDLSQIVQRFNIQICLLPRMNVRASDCLRLKRCTGCGVARARGVDLAEACSDSPIKASLTRNHEGSAWARPAHARTPTILVSMDTKSNLK